MSNSIIGNFETDGYVICRGIVTPQEISEMRAEILSNLQYGFQNSGGISIPDFIHYKDAFRLTSALKDNQMITSILQNRIFKTNDFRFCGHNDIGINRIVGQHKDKLNGEYARQERTNIWAPTGPDGGKQGIVKVLVYLQEHDGGEGDGTGLTVVPGSHMRSDYGTQGAISPRLEVGDVVIFDQRITHRGAWRKYDGEPRILLAFGYGLNNAFTDDFETGTIARQVSQRNLVFRQKDTD